MQSDLTPLGTTARLIMKQRNSKNEVTLTAEKLDNQKLTYMVDESDLEYYAMSKGQTTFDFYIELFGKRKRLGKDRNGLMVDLDSTVDNNKLFYITKGDYLAFQTK